MAKPIEVELRAQILPKQFNPIVNKLKQACLKMTISKRLSVMFFFKQNRQQYDLRIRTKGKGAEIVVKRGRYESHRRIEYSQDISRGQFLGLVKLFSLFKFQTKVGERTNHIFELPQGVTATLVKAGPLAYLELEKMSLNREIAASKKILLKWFARLEIKPIKKEREFMALCKELTRYVDWNFYATPVDFIKLKKGLNKI